MSANVGDRIRQHSNHTDTPDRTGTIVAVLGQDGGPPYRIRFDSGEETIVAPGPDATIEPPTLSERADQVREAAEEKVGEAVENVREGAERAAGDTARTVADAAEKIARRFER